MSRTLNLFTLTLLLGSLAAPSLLAQGRRAQRPCQGTQLRKRDGSCQTPAQGRGVRKQDGTGPRAGTPACPQTPKPAKP